MDIALIRINAFNAFKEGCSFNPCFNGYCTYTEKVEKMNGKKIKFQSLF